MKVEQQNSQQKAGLHIALTEKKQINRNCKLSELDQFFKHKHGVTREIAAKDAIKFA